MHTVVERELELNLVLSAEHSIAVPARLTYRTDDPYAVHFAFHVGTEAPVVRWTFARELLLEGASRPCGCGDVRVWPVQTEARSVICVALSSPHGDALLEMPAAVVSAWLQLTLQAVPPGREYERLGIDGALDSLLATALPEDRRPWRSGSPEEPPEAGG